jgi:tRNA dimethylallyltransferase
MMGPTGSGKTEVAETLAAKLNAQLINADAFQAYRGMDIGTAKPKDRGLYRLLDIKSPSEDYGVGEFCALAQAELENLHAQKKSAVVVGGTGLYIRALFQEYDDLKPLPDQTLRDSFQGRDLDDLIQQLETLDPQIRSKIDTSNRVRVTRALERALDPRPPVKVVLPPYRKTKLGLSVNPMTLDARITERAHRMVQNGWVQEVEALLEAGYGPADPGFKAIGYSEIAYYLEGKTGLEEAIATAIAETRRYAKRQRTWLRSEPELETYDPADPKALDRALERITG